MGFEEGAGDIKMCDVEMMLLQEDHFWRTSPGDGKWRGVKVNVYRRPG